MVLDINTGATRKLNVEIKTDMPEARPYLKEVKDDISGFDSSPAGKRLVIEARGELFSVPCKDGPTRNLTNSSGARDKNPAWSPDGKYIAYISDESGEYNVYIIDQMGAKDAIKLTDFKNGYRHTLRWSPDAKKLAFTDQTLSLNILDVESKKLTTIDKAYFENIDVSIDLKPIYDFNWSPDSRYIAYSKMDEDLVNKVYIYSFPDETIHLVSTIFNDFHPVFSRDGNICSSYLTGGSIQRFVTSNGKWFIRKPAGFIASHCKKMANRSLSYKVMKFRWAKRRKKKPRGERRSNCNDRLGRIS